MHGEVVPDGPVLGDLALGQAEGVRVLDIESAPGGWMQAKPMKSNPAQKVPVQRILVIPRSPAASVCRVSKRMSGNAARWARMSPARNC